MTPAELWDSHGARYWKRRDENGFPRGPGAVLLYGRSTRREVQAGVVAPNEPMIDSNDRMASGHFIHCEDDSKVRFALTSYSPKAEIPA